MGIQAFLCILRAYFFFKSGKWTFSDPPTNSRFFFIFDPFPNFVYNGILHASFRKFSMMKKNLKKCFIDESQLVN